jgi:hypothetical protein
VGQIEDGGWGEKSEQVRVVRVEVEDMCGCKIEDEE